MFGYSLQKLLAMEHVELIPFVSPLNFQIIKALWLEPKMTS